MRLLGLEPVHPIQEPEGHQVDGVEMRKDILAANAHLLLHGKEEIMKPITKDSDQLRDYMVAVNNAVSLKQLQFILSEYKPLAKGAYDQCPKNVDEFAEWRHGLNAERRGEFAGTAFMEKFGEILIPSLMARVSIVSARFSVPFGAAFEKLLSYGMIKHNEDGTYDVAPEVPE